VRRARKGAAYARQPPPFERSRAAAGLADGRMPAVGPRPIELSAAGPA